MPGRPDAPLLTASRRSAPDRTLSLASARLAAAAAGGFLLPPAGLGGRLPFGSWPVAGALLGAGPRNTLLALKVQPDRVDHFHGCRQRPGATPYRRTAVAAILGHEAECPT